MKKRTLLVILSILTFLIIWQVVFCLIDTNIILPAPSKVLPIIARSLLNRETLHVIWQTAWKVLLALVFSTVLGILSGFFLGRFTFLFHFIRPWIMVIQSVPVISWLTLVIFAWGIGWKGPVFISVLSLLPGAIFTTISGVHNLDSNLLEMAKFYQVPSIEIFKDIYFGSFLPFFVAILDINIGQAWKVILVTEYLCGGDGLGEKILIARMNINTAEAWGFTLMAVILGISTEVLLKFALQKVYHNELLSKGHEAFKIL
ncbi:MAG: ABC transporter permease subunit [Chloroflexi bacterium]|nr:ABC transporter permease subunit [Chloroflexota bacterium]